MGSHGLRENLRGWIANIPHRYIVRWGRMLGSVAYHFDIPHRRIVRRNLNFSQQGYSREHIKILSKRVFKHLGITFLEICQMAFFTRREFLDHFRVSGEEHLTRALRQNKGAIIISAHIGNWEMALQFATCYFQRPITGVAKKIRYNPLNRWVNRYRTRFGNKIIYKKGALPEMRQTLREGGLLGLLIDQSRRSEGVEGIFFGRKVTTTPSAAFLAIRCGSPVLPIFCVREADGRLTVQVHAPLEMTRTHDLRSDLVANTQIMTDTVENMIRQYPEQWFWFHKRWKKFYPDLYPEYQTRRKRRQERRNKQAQAGG